MSRNQKLLLTILGLYVIFDFVLGALVGLYLWESSKSATIILSYYITLFSSIMLVSQFNSKIVSKVGIKKSYILSIILGISQSLILLFFGKNIQPYIIPFGALAGLNIGIQAFSYTLVVSRITEGADPTYFLGLKSATMNIVSIVSIPILTYLIKISGGYAITYQLGLLVGIVIMYLISRLSIDEKGSASTIATQPTSSLLAIDEVRYYLLTRLIYGIFNGPVWAVLGVVTYLFVGDVSTWGVLTTIFTVINIVGSYYYGKLKNEQVSQFISVVGTFVFGTLAIILATNWTMATFLVYQVGLVLLNSSFSIHYEATIYNMTRNNEDISQNLPRILSLGEIAIGVGRIIPLVILVLSNFTFDHPLMLQILFVVISTAPLLILSTLNKIIPHSQRYVTINS